MQILVSGQFPSYTHDVQFQSISSLSMETSLFKQQKIPFSTHFFHTKIPTVGAKIPSNHSAMVEVVGKSVRVVDTGLLCGAPVHLRIVK